MYPGDERVRKRRQEQSYLRAAVRGVHSIVRERECVPRQWRVLWRCRPSEGNLRGEVHSSGWLVSDGMLDWNNLCGNLCKFRQRSTKLWGLREQVCQWFSVCFWRLHHSACMSRRGAVVSCRRDVRS